MSAPSPCLPRVPPSAGRHATGIFVYILAPPGKIISPPWISMRPGVHHTPSETRLMISNDPDGAHSSYLVVFVCWKYYGSLSMACTGPLGKSRRGSTGMPQAQVSSFFSATDILLSGGSTKIHGIFRTILMVATLSIQIAWSESVV